MAKSKKKRKKHGSSGRSSGGSKGGVFSSMRGGMKNMVGSGKKKSTKKRGVTFWDVLFWIAAGLLGAAALYRFFD